MNLSDMERTRAFRADRRQQLPQPRAAVLDECLQRHNLCPLVSLYIKYAGLDLLVCGSGESGDFLFSGRQCLDGALPAPRTVHLPEQAIRREIVDGDRNDELCAGRRILILSRTVLLDG